MRIYKVFFPIEDIEPDEAFAETNLYTAKGLCDFLNEAIEDGRLNQSTVNRFDLDQVKSVTSTDLAIEILTYDGYLVDFYDFNE